MTAMDRHDRPLDAVETRGGNGGQPPFNEYPPRVRGGSFATVLFIVVIAWLMLMGYGALCLYNWFSH